MTTSNTSHDVGAAYQVLLAGMTHHGSAQLVDATVGAVLTMIGRESAVWMIAGGRNGFNGMHGQGEVERMCRTAARAWVEMCGLEYHG